ncbi:hypothetical protein CCP2SC5_1310006 [Azospirillaceae bacterium]
MEDATDSRRVNRLTSDSILGYWQPHIRYYLLDEGAFPKDELARRETLVALLFRLEQCSEIDDLEDLIDEVISWFRHHPDSENLKRLFTELVTQSIQNMGIVNQIRIPEDLKEIRNMLATRTLEWKRQLVAQGESAGESKGKANMLLRQLRRRFKTLPSHIEERVLKAASDQLDAWMDQLMDATSLDNIFGPTQSH